MIQHIITDAEIDAAWGNANFGQISKRDLILDTLKKVAQAWNLGHTAMSIVTELGLVEKRNNQIGLSNKGLMYLLAAAKNTDVPYDPEKQKANELVEMFMQIIPTAFFFPNTISIPESLRRQIAEQSAIICVEEILIDKKIGYSPDIIEERNYWKQVISHIKNVSYKYTPNV